MIEYLKNTTTNKLVKNQNLGPWFRTEIWVNATQSEIDAHLLDNAKKDKIIVLKTIRNEFVLSGFTYNENIFKLNDVSLSNVIFKDNCNMSVPNRFKFTGLTNQVDFIDVVGWVNFKEAIIAEKDRIMVYYTQKKLEINNLTNITDIENIIIDFSV